MFNHKQRSQDNLLMLLLFSKLLKINTECKENAIMPMLLTMNYMYLVWSVYVLVFVWMNGCGCICILKVFVLIEESMYKD